MTEPKPPRGRRSSDMDLIRSVWEEARDLIKRLEGSTVQRFSVEAGETKIEIERASGAVAPAASAVAPVAAASAPAPAVEDAAALDRGHPVVAPLVGTFYSAAQPGAKPFVEEGDVVDEGQTVAIVEAMKLMNHVKTDQSGRVVEILCQDGDWVEFEQPIMYLEPLE
jgi:acetyl-CoA carboxylase biotin carboxyl carrier protein